MDRLVFRDIEQNPDLFELRLPLSPSEVEVIEEELGTSLPASFRALLERYGQGLAFGSESLLGAHEIDEGLGEIVSVNRSLRDEQDLPAHLIVFHLGTGGLHAFDSLRGGLENPVVALDEDTLASGREYADFDTWYEEYLRAQYSDLLGHA